MTRIKRFRLKAAALFICVLSVAACASQSQLPVRSIRQANDPLSIIWLHAYPGRDGVSVSGFVKRPRSGYTPTTGYIRVDALGGDGEILATEYFSIDMMTMRKKQGRTFSVRLRNPGPSRIDHIVARYVARMPME